MSPRLLAASLLVSATAYAQAPGEWSAPPSEPPAYQPVVVVAAPPSVPRWSIGLTFGQTELGPSNPEYGGSATFAGAALAFRYRPWRKVELELTLGGGREVIGEDQEGDLAMGTGTLAVRYRFNQRDKLNWYMLAGVGATTVAQHDAPDDVIDANQRPHLALGGGVEYRFHRLALHFELRGYAVGQTETERMDYEEGYTTNEGLTGGSFSLGASYYFGR